MSYRYDETVARNLSKFWWQEDKNQVHETIFATVDALRDDQNYRRLANIRHMSLYGNYHMGGLGGSEYGRAISGDALTYNVCRSAVDTVLSKITKNPPRTTVLPIEGNWALRNKSKRLNLYIQGVMYEVGLYEKASYAFHDSCIFDDGHLHWFIENGKIVCDKLFPDEIIVDDRESVYGYPRQMFHEKGISREVLIEKWSKHKNKIKKADDSVTFSQGDKRVSFQPRVIEVWHLPSGPDATDGRHVICISNQTLVDDPWTRPDFPVEQVKWNRRTRGYRGRGLVEELAPIQVELNVTLEKIQRALALAAPQ